MQKFTNEIINKEVLEELLAKESYIKLKTRFILASRSYIRLTKEIRKDITIREGEIIIIRIWKKDIVYELVSKISRWGKIHIPKEIVQKLNLEDQGYLDIGIIKHKPFSQINKTESIDLSKIENHEGMKIINRNNNYVTIYKEYQTSLTIPRIIKIDENLLEAVYLIHGDGSYQSKLYFSNVNYELHKFIVKIFDEYFKLPKELWKYRVNHSNRELVERSIDFWCKNVNINKNKFYPTKTLSSFNTKAYGDLRIIIDNLIVASLYRYLLKNIILDNKLKNLIALNGILDAEGSAQINKIGLHRINISFNEKEKDMFRSLLEKSDLTFFIENSGSFDITSWEKLYKFIIIFLKNNLLPFNLHIERKFNVIHGFLNHSFTRTLIKYLSAIKEYPKINYKELSYKLNIRRDCVSELIKKSRYKQFVDIKKEGRKYVVSINDKGVAFLDEIKHLEKVYINLKSHLEDYRTPIAQFYMEAGMELPFEKENRKLLLRKDSVTDNKYGKRPEERTIKELLDCSVICLNKPDGPTSHEVADFVKKILKVEKCGHSGTLE